ncbi:incA family protein [Chlamydia ibidis]|uniref:IncA family protein n=2 Tax=Chlamydia ibidis TaxID=1405396 RepID=S7KGL2_9CHLA|nr:IncA family protein [Chlamydia ibidis]EPP35296.1 incA family protein [Chlamydia ibidis]EQM62788.1 incA family protein [Chlamydia ibidis 10-1398/6]
MSSPLNNSTIPSLSFQNTSCHHAGDKSCPYAVPSSVHNAEMKLSTLEKVLRVAQITALLTLLGLGILAIGCACSCVALPIGAAVTMISIMLLSFVIVLLALGSSSSAAIYRKMQTGLQVLHRENVRLNTEISSLQNTNNELKSQLDQLKLLHSTLESFGNKLETHTGDFGDLVRNFQEEVERFKTIGDKVDDTLQPFLRLAESMRATFSQESVTALTNTVAELRGQLSLLTTVLNNMREQAEQQRKELDFLSIKKLELEESVKDLKGTITSLKKVEASLIAHAANLESMSLHSTNPESTASPNNTTSSTSQVNTHWFIP